MIKNLDDLETNKDSENFKDEINELIELIQQRRSLNMDLNTQQSNEKTTQKDDETFQLMENNVEATDEFPYHESQMFERASKKLNYEKEVPTLDEIIELVQHLISLDMDADLNKLQSNEEITQKDDETFQINENNDEGTDEFPYHESQMFERERKKQNYKEDVPILDKTQDKEQKVIYLYPYMFIPI